MNGNQALNDSFSIMKSKMRKVTKKDWEATKSINLLHGKISCI